MPSWLAIIAIFSALLTSCEPYSRSNSGVSATDKAILYDFRNPKMPDVPRLDSTTERKVLSSVSTQYNGSHDCPASRKPYRQAFAITALTEGAFTAPDVKQTAYLVRRLDCKTADRTYKIAVFAGDKMVASTDISDSAILKSFDLDHDGKDELLLASDSAPLSARSITAELVQFDKTTLRTIENFGTVYRNTCDANVGASPQQRFNDASKAPDRSVDALLLWYLPRPHQEMANFMAQRFRAECPAQGQQPRWTQLGK